MAEGLDGVIAAKTALSEVDGAAGVLIVRGYPVDVLARDWDAEGVANLLIDGLVPGWPSGEALQAALSAARVAAFAHVAALDDELLKAGPMAAVRTLLSRLPEGDGVDQALALLAGSVVFTAAVARRADGLKPIAPDPSLSQAADLLRMMRGTPAPAKQVAALDAYLATVADHGFNASTFTARVIASTRAGLVSSAVGAMGALSGPLHGGAPGPVLDMLDAIGTPQNAAAWLREAVKRGDRLMGFGHRIYKVRDPRADALKAALERLGGDAGRARFASAVEAAAIAVLQEEKPGRSLDVNVEFYTALLLEALQIPRALFTCIFACGRMAGWIAHAREQVETGRLIRPQSLYVGPRPKVAA